MAEGFVLTSSGHIRKGNCEFGTREAVDVLNSMLDEIALQKYNIERLELRGAGLIKERDLYNERRCEAMAKCEEWRRRFQTVQTIVKDTEESLKQEVEREAAWGNDFKMEHAKRAYKLYLFAEAGALSRMIAGAAKAVLKEDSSTEENV